MAETKHERFIRLAERRTNAVLEALRVLGNCANRANYDYMPEEIEKIFQALETQTKTTKAVFTASARQNFTLRSADHRSVGQ